MAKSLKKGPGAPQSAGGTTAGNPDRKRVAMRAYELYLARGRGDGKAIEDWLIAERELLQAAPPERENRARTKES